jgi:hypothetical protein
MSSADDAWLILLLVALFGFLFFLRIKFPNASKRSETAVLVSVTILFFSICNFFLSPHKRATQSVPQVIHAQEPLSQ